MPRLFIAVETPQDIRAALARVIDDLKQSGADVRWEATAKLHLTLKFLGNTDDRRVAHVITALEDVARNTSSFNVQYASIGRFPPTREPRIIWVGVRDLDAALTPLAAAVESAMAALGFAPEERPFHPHVTIGRVKSRQNVHDLLRRMESITFESQPTRVSHISLVKSELKPSGSVYTTMKVIGFPGKDCRQD